MVDVPMGPAGVVLREFRIGAVLNRTFAIFGRRFVPIMVLAAIVALPYLIVYWGQTPASMAAQMQQSPGAVLNLYGRFALPLILGFILRIVAQATIVYAIFQDMLGRDVDIGPSLSRGLARFLPIIGLLICEGLGILVGFMLLFVPGLILLTMWFIALPACVVEKLGPFGSLGRSATLTKGHRWALFGLILLVGIASLIAGAIFGGVMGAVGGHGGVAIAQFVIQALTVGFSSVLVVVVYHDLRVAKEGVDTATIAAVFD